MEYTLPIDGIEKHKVSLEVEGVFTKPKLLYDGVPVEEGPKKNLYTLRTDDNDRVIAWVRRGVFDPSPVVIVDEQQIGIAEPFTTWQWLWLLLPVVLLFMTGGVLGLAIGAWITFFNGRVMRLTKPTKPGVRFLLTVAVFVAGLLINLLAANFFRLWLPFAPPEK